MIVTLGFLLSILFTKAAALDCNGPYETYDSCPNTYCSEDCSQASPTGDCPKFLGVGPVVICKPACRCIKYYWRSNGTCVPYAECPNLSTEDNQ